LYSPCSWPPYMHSRNTPMPW